MGKVATFFLLTLLLSTLSFAARTVPTFPNESLAKTQAKPQPQVAVEVEDEDRCEGIAEDECLMRRTLAAHLDYIYTQKQNP
ncbi:phytosulfokine 4 precursor [Hibiscus trionum]|uniref:Phytosulfokine n=1 Tax=Hibiscus trionum TaxID=183268 RepID=A0A9W7HZI9_HIBTR|nr:phytosulfokine 4 precursor [Hibiscus trionum]